MAAKFSVDFSLSTLGAGGVGSDFFGVLFAKSFWGQWWGGSEIFGRIIAKYLEVGLAAKFSVEFSVSGGGVAANASVEFSLSTSGASGWVWQRFFRWNFR